MNKTLLKWVFFLCLLLGTFFLGLQFGPEEHFDDSIFKRKEDSLLMVIATEHRKLSATAAQRDSSRLEVVRARRRVTEVEVQMEFREKNYIKERGERRKKWFQMSKDSLAEEAKRIYMKYNPDSILVDDDTVISNKMTMVFMMEKTEQVPFLEAQLVDESKKVNLKDTENSYLRNQITQYQADSATYRGLMDAQNMRFTNAEEKHAQKEQNLEKQLRREKWKTRGAIVIGVGISILAFLAGS